ncbi:hypothetical protein [uncultured Photobacterium sp.]|uniref:hypothetical protein n=1 Tax=uncultured Photobacterium sp. TaxID=173973 RepID=UPI002637605B|nr:hypothetical protein [uncultured Photobacterium sp.]
MFDWLKNIFSHKPEETTDNLVEKQTEEKELRESKQENIARGSSSDKENEQ